MKSLNFNKMMKRDLDRKKKKVHEPFFWVIQQNKLRRRSVF